MAIRTFCAIDIDAAARKSLGRACEKIDAGDAKIRWVARENLHVTMNFLGDVDEDALKEVCHAVRRGAANIRPFDFSVRGLVLIPPQGRRLKMIWGGVEDPHGRMVELYEKLSNELGELGFKRETRPFRPHITLARIKRVRDTATIRESAGRFAETDFGRQHAAEVVVYSSKLSSRGPIYTAMDHAPLGG